MRGGWRGTVVLLVVAGAVTAAPVPPDPRPADDEVPLSAARLLRRPEVQKELSLTAGQRAAVRDGLAAVEADYAGKLAARPGPGGRPGAGLDALLRERAAAVDRFLAGAAARTLTAVQRARLRQADWQVRGPLAFTDPRVARDLRLADAQKAAAVELAARLDARAGRYLAVFGNDDADNLRRDLLAFRSEAVTTLDDALTPEQRAAWKRALGDPVRAFDPAEVWLATMEEESV